MVLFQDLHGALQVERLLGSLVPRELGHGLEVGADHLRFHRIAIRPLQPFELAVDLLPCGLRSSRASKRFRSSSTSVPSPPSPSSFWIALSCSRRNISRCRSPSSS